MKRTMLVLTLAVLASAGCRAIGPNGNAGCSAPVGPECCESCGEGCSEQCGNQCACGRDGNLANSSVGQGGECCGVFDRYGGQNCGCGDACGDGCHPGPYDCSACDANLLGCNGYRHPNGYVTGNECYCGGPEPCRPPGPRFAPCGNGYCCTCCGQPAASCCCSSGDQNYNFNPGPPVAQTAYPYYTLRGPRDFFLNNPPSIGPY